MAKLFGGGCRSRGSYGCGGSHFGGRHFGRSSGCGSSGCGLSKFKARSGGWGTGCGLFSKICRKKQQASFVYVDSFSNCGCGDNGGYFDYAVGSEYGTDGFQSSVSGCGSCDRCGGGDVFMSGGIAQPGYQDLGGGIPNAVDAIGTAHGFAN